MSTQQSLSSQPIPLLTNLQLVESPRWHEGQLWFSDWMARELRTVDAAGHSEIIANVPSFPFCFDRLPDGQLLVVSGREARLLRMASDGSLVTHVDLRELSTHPWNEIVVDGRGNAYLNNTGFDFPGGDFAPGFIALARPDGSVEKVADGVAFPNGMAVTPDNRTLILAESYGNCLTAFDIGEDGTLANRRVWAHCAGDHPDGICLDAEGAVWYADVGNKRCVRVCEGGEILQVVETDRGCFACMLGGDEGKTLFVLANNWGGPASMGDGAGTGQVLTIEVDISRAGWP
ncbi:MAG: SMP-30/gluconolactonase/LRE family protein [Caldilineaceae bacterium]